MGAVKTAPKVATCEVCGAVYPTNGLRGAIHEPSACRDVLAVRVAELTRERDESLSGALDETRAQLAEEQTAHATLRALWDARCGTIASVQARLTEAEGLLASRVMPCPECTEPVPIRLECPTCGELHIDEGEFATKPHHTHACQHCGAVWRPAVVATVGVRFLPGFKNEAPEPRR